MFLSCFRSVSKLFRTVRLAFTMVARIRKNTTFSRRVSFFLGPKSSFTCWKNHFFFSTFRELSLSRMMISEDIEKIQEIYWFAFAAE